VSERGAVSIRGLTKAFGGLRAVDGVSLDVSPGEFLTLLGPSGCGKTTLLRLVAGFEEPDAGAILISGRDVAELPAYKRPVNTVFQHYALFPHRTVAGNVAFGLEMDGCPQAEIPGRVAKALEMVRLPGLGDRRIEQLSGGQKQRVALARAVVLEPEVLLLDEPFAGLDAPTRAELLPDLGAILRHDRVTTMLVTHDRGEAQALGDRAAVLMAGQIAQLDETARVFHAPASEAVARFIGVETLVTGRVIGRDAGVTIVEVAGRKLEIAAPATVGDDVRLGLRPEDITLLLPTEVAPLSSARNYLTGTIVRVTPSTPAVRVVVDVGFPLVATVTARSVADLGLAEGVPTIAAFKASAVHLIGPG
jgi:molybdopterin-binding protein